MAIERFDSPGTSSLMVHLSSRKIQNLDKIPTIVLFRFYCILGLYGQTCELSRNLTKKIPIIFPV